MISVFRRLPSISLLTLLMMAISLTSLAETLPEFSLTLSNHLFFPSKLEVPANQKFKLIIHNKDSTAEEFDSFDLNREKVIFPNRSSTLFVGPLEPGRYDFFGEYNSNTAKGSIIATSLSKPASSPMSTNQKLKEDDRVN